MKYAKIIVKNNYEQRGDLVLRSYIRALRKLRANRFLDGENALIYGIVDDNGNFFEMLTREKIDYDDYIIVSREEYIGAYSLKGIVGDSLKKVMEKILFNRDVLLNIVHSTVVDLAEDNRIEFEAYDSFKSRINPYQRLNEETMNAYNECNNFLRKLNEIKAMKKIDSIPASEDEFEVLENPKKLVRK